jgi:hypothetical protein
MPVFEDFAVAGKPAQRIVASAVLSSGIYFTARAKQFNYVQQKVAAWVIIPVCLGNGKYFRQKSQTTKWIDGHDGHFAHLESKLITT